MKLVLVCVILVVALAFVHCSNAQSQNFEWGRREICDRQIYIANVYKKAKLMEIVVKYLSYSGSLTITYINCTDQYTNGDGGYVSLLSGGVGYTDADIQFTSQLGQGFNFIVEIFGH